VKINIFFLSIVLLLSTFSPLTAQENTVKIDTIYYMNSNPPGGGTSEVIIEITPNNSGTLQVSVSEEEVEATGKQWKSSAWMAVLLGTMLLGKDATDYKFNFIVKGRIDGPSAGCLLTSGVIAGLRGQKIKEDAAMTGTINPDGTVGPVGGIPQKLQGAKKKGKKLILVPLGQRYDTDMATGQDVDLIKRGESLGIEVKEVSNIYEAYNLLTGDTLSSLSSSTARPELPQKAFEKLKGKAIEAYSRYQKARGEYKTFPQAYQEHLAEDVNYDDSMAKRGQEALNQGMACVAYERTYAAATDMEANVLILKMLQLYFNSGFDKVVNYLGSKESARTNITGMIQRLKSEDISTASDYTALYDTYNYVVTAEGYIKLGDMELAKFESGMSEAEVFNLIRMAGLYYTYAETTLQQGKDLFDIARESGDGDKIQDKDKIKRLGKVLSATSKANLTSFDSIIIDEWASESGKHSNVIRDILKQIDYKYAMTEAINYGSIIISDKYVNESEAAPMIIGSSIGTYILSSQLIAKYYSLGAVPDKSFNSISSIKNEKALASMLDFADRRAVELINANGQENSVLPIYYYEYAKILRQSVTDDQLEGLGYYWHSIILSQLQSCMAGSLNISAGSNTVNTTDTGNTPDTGNNIKEHTVTGNNSNVNSGSGTKSSGSSDSSCCGCIFIMILLAAVISVIIIVIIRSKSHKSNSYRRNYGNSGYGNDISSDDDWGG